MESLSINIKSDVRLKNVIIYKREKGLIGDNVSVCNLISYFIYKFSITEPIIQIHVTSPFLNVQTIKNAYTYLQFNDSVVSCTKHNSRFWRSEDYGFCPVNHNPLRLEQTQDLPSLYEENSAFYIFKPDVLINLGGRIGQNPKFYPIEYPEFFDIDTEEHWNIAKTIEKVLSYEDGMATNTITRSD